MNHDVYEQLKAEAKAEYERSIDAIDRVWQLTQKLPGGGVTPATTVAPRVRTLVPVADSQPRARPTADSAIARTIGLSDRIRAAIHDLSQEFTINDVIQAIGPDGVNKTSVATSLRRMSESPQGGIRVIQGGKGKRPSIYSKEESLQRGA